MVIPYQVYRFTLQAKGEIHLPPYKGSAFRGGFGAAFRRVVCALRRTKCSDCLLKSRCVYAYIFETFPDRETDVLRVGKHEKAPHPFVIEPPSDTVTVYEPGRTLTFNLILVGRGNDYLPYFVYAFEELGKMGIGKGRGQFLLNGVDGLDGESVYRSEEGVLCRNELQRLNVSWNHEEDANEKLDAISITFETPVRIMHQRRLSVDVEFKILITALLRRLALLAAFHCEQTGPEWDHKTIIAKAEKIATTESRLTWYDWERYSSRQQTRMKMGGLIGSVTYEGRVKPFMSVLRAGEALHVGKGTSFGLGKYRLSNMIK